MPKGAFAFILRNAVSTASFWSGGRQSSCLFRHSSDIVSIFPFSSIISFFCFSRAAVAFSNVLLIFFILRFLMGAFSGLHSRMFLQCLKQFRQIGRDVRTEKFFVRTLSPDDSSILTPSHTMSSSTSPRRCSTPATLHTLYHSCLRFVL